MSETNDLDLAPVQQTIEMADDSQCLDLGGVVIHGTKAERKALFAAMAKAQAVFEPILKDTANTFFKSQYAPLENVLKAIRPGLAANGLFFSQPVVDGRDGSKELHTKVAHCEGGVMHSVMTIPATWSKIQDFGALVTYLRRYCAQSFWGVNSEHDDDGNVASGREAPPERERKVPEPRQEPKRPEPPKSVPAPANEGEAVQGPAMITEDQGKAIGAEFKRLGWPKMRCAEFAHTLTGMNSSNMTRQAADVLLATLKNTEAQAS